MSPGATSIASQELWPWLLLGCGAVSLVVILFLLWLIVRGRGPAREEPLQRELIDLMDELSDLAREVGAQLDSRAARLKALIQDADEHLEQLHQARSAGTVPGVQESRPVPGPVL